MRTLLIALPLLASMTVHAQNCDSADTKLCDEQRSLNLDAIAKAFNTNLSGVTLCDPKESVIAQVDDGKGGKKLVRTAQNTWTEFKKVGDDYQASFSAFHRNSKTGEVKPSKMYIKLVAGASENKFPLTGKNKAQLQLFMDGHYGTASGKYDLQLDSNGNIDILETSSKMFQAKRGKENLDKGAVFMPTNIKVSKSNGKTSYVIDSIRFDFTKEQMDQIEKETGKKFFTGNFNEKINEYEGVPYSIDEVRKLADHASIKEEVENGLTWSNCPEVTEEEAIKFNSNAVKEHNSAVRNSSKGNTLKDSARKLGKEIKQSASKAVKKAKNSKVKEQ